MKKHNQLLKMILSALFLALAYVLPFLTGQIPQIGSMLCPMHIPGITLRLYLRMAMGTCRRFYLTLVPLADDTRHAAAFSDGALYGI